MMKDRTLLRKFGAMAMAFTLSLSLMAAPAFAAAGDGDGWTRPEFTEEYKNGLMAAKDLTINGTIPGATYDIYPVLTVKDIQENAGMLLFKYEVSETGNAAAMKAIMAELAAGEFGYAAAKAVNVVEGEGEDAKTYPVKAGVVAKDGEIGFQVTVDGDMDVQTAYSKWTATGDGKTFAMKFADALKAKIDAAIEEGTYVRGEADKVTKKADGTTVVFESIPVGYYIVTSSAGKNVMSFTLPGEKDAWEINEKNTAPTVGKKVFDSDDVSKTEGTNSATGSWKDANDAKIGDTVTYKITAELYKGSENISVYDKMTDGLTFGDITSVRFYPRSADGTYDRMVYKFGGTEETKDLELTGHDEIYVLTKDEDGHGFKLTFKNAFTNPAEADRKTDPKNNVFLGDLSTLEDDGGRIEIWYTATLNENAFSDTKRVSCTDGSEDHEHGDACYVEGNVNVNTTYVQYGHIPGVDPGEEPGPDDPTPPGETPKDKTETYTYKFEIDKFVTGNSASKLAGAKFEIRRKAVGIGTESVEGKFNAYFSGDALTLPAGRYDISKEPVMNFVDMTPTDEGYTGSKIYRVAKDGETGTTAVLETNVSGQIVIKGLDSDLYSITETEAPNGYNKLEKPVMFAIGSQFSGKGGTVFDEDMAATKDRVDDNADYSFKKLANTTIGIGNASGIRMPDTGGIGTTVFYVVGGVLAAGACVLLVAKKRAGRSGD